MKKESIKSRNMIDMLISLHSRRFKILFLRPPARQSVGGEHDGVLQLQDKDVQDLRTKLRGRDIKQTELTAAAFTWIFRIHLYAGTMIHTDLPSYRPAASTC